MFKNLIPWKKRNDQLAIGRDEPTRQATPEDHPLTRIRQEFDSMLNRFFDEHWLESRMFNELPTVWGDADPTRNWNLGWEDKGKEYVFETELPGFEPDEFDVKVSGNLLTVHAEHKEQAKRGHGYHYGSYRQTFTLPQGADDSNIDARYHRGILEIRLPKSESAQTKRIEVKSD